MGFSLHFHFDTNPFFTNTTLTKVYEMKCEPQLDDPFSFEVKWLFTCQKNRLNEFIGRPLYLQDTLNQLFAGSWNIQVYWLSGWVAQGEEPDCEAGNLEEKYKLYYNPRWRRSRSTRAKVAWGRSRSKLRPTVSSTSSIPLRFLMTLMPRWMKTPRWGNLGSFCNFWISK